MNYPEIETFLTIVELKSISAAAKKLYISQGTASHRIQNLEADLEVQLFYRHPGQKQLSLTNEGQEFHTLAKQWKALYQETQNLKLAKNFTTLSVAGIEAVNTFALMPFYKELALQYPQIKLKLSTYHSNEVYELINKHSIDLGFTYSYAHYPSVQVEPLFTEPLVPITSKVSSLPLKTSLASLDLSKEIYINWGVDFEIWHNQQFQSSAERFITAGNCHMLLSLLEIPDTWGFVPKSVFDHSLSHHFQILELDEPLLEKTCYKLSHKTVFSEKKESLHIFSEALARYIRTKEDS